jgi:hypothetical protein
MSQTLGDDAEILNGLVDSAWRECAAPQDGFVVLDSSLFDKYSAALQRYIIRRAMRTLVPDVDVTYETLMRALAQRRRGAEAQRCRGKKAQRRNGTKAMGRWKEGEKGRMGDGEMGRMGEWEIGRLGD